MRDLPVPPYDLALNTTMQTVATVVLWGGSIALLAYAYRLVRQERSLFPLLLVLAVAAGSVIEPLYDIAYHLFWLDNGQQWTLFTAFGLPQPVWVIPSTLEHQRRSVVENILQPA
jgi:ABC-type glycerol-3-phosphate transport system permease component